MGTLDFQDLGFDQYAAAVRIGSVQGIDSPFLAHDVCDALLAAARDQGVAPYALLAWLHSENRMATDIGDGLLRVHNAAGIKYVGQSRATSGADAAPPVCAPASEGSAPYCAFATWGDFFWTLAHNIKSILPDAFAAGDINRIAWYYTLGSAGLARADAGEQHPKAAFFAAYMRNGDAPLPAPQPATPNIPPDKIADEAMRHLNEQRSGAYDTLNGNHFWCNPATNDFWCESFVERVHEHCGVPVTARDTAAIKGRALRDQGYMHTDGSNPPRGSVISLDEQYYSGGGHTAIALGNGTMVGTCSPEGVGIRPIPHSSPGYMGWSYYPGVGAGGSAPAPQPAHPLDKLIVPGNPHNAGVTDPALLIGVSGAFTNRWRILPDPLTILGFPLTNERQARVFEPDGSAQQRTVQLFERGTLIYQPEQPKPWDVVVALTTQRIVSL